MNALLQDSAQVDMYTADCHTGLMSVLDQYPQLTVAQGEGNWNNGDSYARAFLRQRCGSECSIGSL